MPVQNLTYNYTILAAGGSVSLNVASPYTKYVIGAASSTTLLADQEFIHTGTPNDGITFYIEYIGNVVSNYAGGKTVSFFGVDLTDAQAASRCDITAFYTSAGVWNVIVRPDLSEQQNQSVLDGDLIDALNGGLLVDNSVTLAKLDQLTAEGVIVISDYSGQLQELSIKDNAKILIGNGTTAASKAVSGAITITSDGVTTIPDGTIATAKIIDDNITIDKVDNNLKYDVIVVPVSFESGEQTTYKVKIPYACTVVEVYGECVKAIANTDNGTITCKDNSGASLTDGLLTFVASDALLTAYTVSPSGNNIFIAGDLLQILTAKTTAGGKVLLSIKVLKG